jgi:hypothetical protein
MLAKRTLRLLREVSKSGSAERDVYEMHCPRLAISLPSSKSFRSARGFSASRCKRNTLGSSPVSGTSHIVARGYAVSCELRQLEVAWCLVRTIFASKAPSTEPLLYVATLLRTSAIKHSLSLLHHSSFLLATSHM